MTSQIVQIQKEKTISISSRLISPHYTDNRFNKEQTVFLAPGYHTVSSFGCDVVKEASYEYSDRLWQWDYETSEKAWKEASEKFPKNSAALFEEYLRRYYKNPDLELVHIIAGVNRGNGYPYRVYGYISHKKE